MKKFLKKLVSCIVTAATALSMAVISPEVFEGFNVAAGAASVKWDSEEAWRPSYAVFSQDIKNVYGDSAYSVKLENTDYNVSYVTKKFNVEPETKYIFTVYVKYSAYELDPACSGDSGASVRILDSAKEKTIEYSSGYSGKDWKQLRLVFTSEKAQKAVNIRYLNGAYNHDCKGTAWFSGMTLEKFDPKKWNAEYSYAKTAEFSVDTKTKHSGSYSLKIKNNGYDVSYYQRSFEVKPETTYHLSAYVKYSGYKLSPQYTVDSGACINIYAKSGQTYSSKSTDTKWVKLECSFTTGKNENSVDIRLYNGMFSKDCKGTAWFSDIRFEEAETTNYWNVLALTFRNVSAKVTFDNKTSTYKSFFSDGDIANIRNYIGRLKTDFSEMSDGLVSVVNIDHYTIDDALTELTPYGTGYRIDINGKKLDALLDKLLEKGSYQQMILTAPLNGVSKCWSGIGGSAYKGVMYCQVTFEPGHTEIKDEWHKDFPDGTYVHEILHGAENTSKALSPDTTPKLHDYQTTYKSYWSESIKPQLYKYYSDYMKMTLPDGRGIDPRAYYRLSVYTLVSDDMTPGAGVTVTDTLPTHISKAAAVPTIADMYYAGKAVKPTVTVKGLTKGTDYTVTYADNNAPGTAKAIIKGKGKYTGSIEVTFKIKLKKTTAKISSSTLKWTAIKGADGYEVYYSKDGGSYKLLTDTKDTQYALSGLKTGSYKFKVRAYSSTNTGKMYASWSAVVKANKK